MRRRRAIRIDRLVVEGADRFDRARFERALRAAFATDRVARHDAVDTVEARAARAVKRRSEEPGE